MKKSSAVALVSDIAIFLLKRDVKLQLTNSAVAEMGDRLTTIDMGRKVGGCCAPFLEGGGRAEAYLRTIHPAVWPQTWA